MKFKLVMLAILFILAGFIVGYATANTMREAVETDIITVCNGDTLWSLAEQYCPEDEDVRKWIYEVEKLNNIKPSDLTNGMRIEVIK